MEEIITFFRSQNISQIGDKVPLSFVTYLNNSLRGILEIFFRRFF